MISLYRKHSSIISEVGYARKKVEVNGQYYIFFEIQKPEADLHLVECRRTCYIEHRTSGFGTIQRFLQLDVDLQIRR